MRNFSIKWFEFSRVGATQSQNVYRKAFILVIFEKVVISINIQ